MAASSGAKTVNMKFYKKTKCFRYAAGACAHCKAWVCRVSIRCVGERQVQRRTTCGTVPCYALHQFSIHSCAWDTMALALWRRYPNPHSKHVLTEDAISRYEVASVVRVC